MAIRKNTTIRKTDRQRAIDRGAEAYQQKEVARERRIDAVEEICRTHGAPYAIAAQMVSMWVDDGKKPGEIIDDELSSLASPVRRDDAAHRRTTIAVLSDRFGKLAVRKVAAKRAAILRKEMQFLGAI